MSLETTPPHREPYASSERTRQGLRLAGVVVVAATLIAVPLSGEPGLNLVGLAGLAAIFFDQVYDAAQFLRGVITGWAYIVGRQRIYDVQLALIHSTHRGDQIAIQSPVTHFGAYTLGARVYDRMVSGLKAAHGRGVKVRLLCDAYDDKSLRALRGLIDAGADVRLCRNADPWHYFRFIPTKRLGVELYTHDLYDAPDGRTYRPIADWALRIRRRQVEQRIKEFDEQFSRGLRVSSDHLAAYHDRLVSLQNETQSNLRSGGSATLEPQ